MGQGNNVSIRGGGTLFTCHAVTTLIWGLGCRSAWGLGDRSAFEGTASQCIAAANKGLTGCMEGTIRFLGTSLVLASGTGDSFTLAFGHFIYTRKIILLKKFKDVFCFNQNRF